MTDKETPRCMCVSLRLDSATLHDIEQERGDKTLSTTMNARVCGALSVLSSNAKEMMNND